MNKKLLIVSILAVLMLITISFASTVSSNTETNDDKKESPLYKIRTNRAIGKNLRTILDYIKTKFLGERMFLLPFQWLRNKIQEDSMASIMILCTYEKTELACTCAFFCARTNQMYCTQYQCTVSYPVC